MLFVGIVGCETAETVVITGVAGFFNQIVNRHCILHQVLYAMTQGVYNRKEKLGGSNRPFPSHKTSIFNTVVEVLTRRFSQKCDF